MELNLLAEAESIWRNNYSWALDIYLYLEKSTTNLHELALIKSQIGKLSMASENFFNATQRIFSALAFSKQIEDNELILDNLITLGVIYGRAKDYMAAIYFTKESIIYARKLNDQTTLALCYSNIAGAYIDLEKFDLAKAYLKYTLTLTEATPQTYEHALVLTNIGQVHLAEHNLEEAISYLEKAIRIFICLNMNQHLPHLYRKLSLAHQQLGLLYEAIQDIEKGLTLTESVEDYFQVSHCYLQLSNLYEAFNHPSKALDYYKKYSDLQIKLLSDSSKQQLTDLRKYYDYKMKEGTKNRIVTA